MILLGLEAMLTSISARTRRFSVARQIAPKRAVLSVEEGGKGVTRQSRWIAEWYR